MNLIQNILIATDLSAPSLNALDRAQAIACATGSGLTVVHVVPDSPATPDEQAGASGAARLIQDRLDAAALVDDTAACAPVQVLVESGAVGATIAETAERCSADLLVIGPHGERRLLDLFTGSTTRTLIREAPCPVLVVKSAPDAPYQRVLVAVDFSAVSPLIIQLARALAPGAVLILTNVFDLPIAGKLRQSGIGTGQVGEQRVDARQQALQSIHALAAEAGLASGTYLTSVQRGEPTRCIVEQIAREQCDLLIMGKYGTGLAGKWLLGSVTREVLDQVGCDLLCVVDKRPGAVVPGGDTA